ncbi:hypothetical protein U2261_25770 [Achromobacter xylosoxidans]|jgi:hypothetical protein|uniref:hypothetical protein n=1 Tax=Achromobacter TaxID=222 RepID=UPI0006C468B8|nr:MULTISPECIES: hypothetical protein [Achromobacter]MDZ5618047.1 hypothetical protein [Achromobacter xylosoxidans]MDZ5625864.1 hypothetical protein [Achromobacter xylosoxidans]MDZ5685454.1 hypothetical protein [Achromobacter xylosoxidans]CUJ62004.1 Uncharacterised protein [Achromobacter sp. 2789STDY5608621]
MTDVPQTAPAPPRSKVELLYQEILRESHQLIGRLEQIALQQADVQQALSALPGTIRQAGQEAATQAADHASRAMLDATRALARATSELRVSSRSAQGALPATAWRAGLLCVASSFLGGALCAAVLALTL